MAAFALSYNYCRDDESCPQSSEEGRPAQVIEGDIWLKHNNVKTLKDVAELVIFVTHRI